MIETLGKEVRKADRKFKKQAVMLLFKELRIGPKKGSPWARKIKAKGVYLPSAGVIVASPRVRHQYHSCSKELELSYNGLILN